MPRCRSPKGVSRGAMPRCRSELRIVWGYCLIRIVMWCLGLLKPLFGSRWRIARDPLNALYLLTLSHAWAAFSPINLPSHVRIDSLTYAFSRMSLFDYESAFSRMDWLSHLCFLSRMIFFTYESAFSRMDWLYHLCFLRHEPFHLWIYFLKYRLTLSPMLSHAWAFWPMNVPSHIWIDSLTYAFSRISLFTYESTFSRMVFLSPMLSHAWAFSRMNLPFHAWIDSPT